MALSLVITVVFLLCASKISLCKKAGQYCDKLFITFPVDFMSVIFCQKDKSVSLKPGLKYSGWSCLVPTEVRYYTNDEKFFALPALPGPERNFEDLWGTADPSLPLSVSLLNMTAPYSI